MSFVLAISFALAASGSAAASATDATAAPVKKEKPAKICRTSTKNTGTRISTKVCKTAEEWAAKEDGQDINIKSTTSRSDLDNVGPTATGRPRPN